MPLHTVNLPGTKILLLLIRLQRIERLLHQLAAQFLFILQRQLGVAGDVDDAGSQNDAVGADHFGDGQGGGDLHDWDAGFFEFGGDRSAAARAGASSGGEDHRVDAVALDFFDHLAPQAPGV